MNEHVADKKPEIKKKILSNTTALAKYLFGQGKPLIDSPGLIEVKQNS